MFYFFQCNRKHILYFLAVGLFIVCYTLNIEFTVYDEYQGIAHQVSGGQFSDCPGMDYLFLSYVGYAYLIEFLFVHFNKINWVAVVEISVMIGAVLIYLRRVGELSEKIYRQNWLLFFSLVVAVLSFLDAFTVISLSRPALLMSGISLYSLLFTEYSKFQKWVYHLLFIAGMMIRPEAGFGVICFLGGAYVIFKADLPGFFKKSKWIIFFLSGFALYTWYMMHYVDYFLYNIEPEVEYNFLQGYVKPMAEGVTPQDSIRYLLATNGFIFDPDILTPEYFRSIQQAPGISEILSHATDAINIVTSEIFFYPVSVFLFFIVIFISIYCRRYDLLLKVLLLTAMTITMFVLLKLTSDISKRHIQPFLVLYNLLLLTFVAYSVSYQRITNPAIWSACLILMVISLKIYVSNTREWSEKLVTYCKQSEARRAILEERYQDELIVGTLSSMGSVFYGRYTFCNRREFNNRYMVFETYNFSMHPPYDEYLKRTLKKDHYNANDVYQYFCRHRAIYLAGEKNTTLTKDYLKIIYNNDIEFKKEDLQFKGIDNQLIVSRLVCAPTD